MAQRLPEHAHRVLQDRASPMPLTAWEDQTVDVRCDLASHGYVDGEGALTDAGREYLAEHNDQDRMQQPGLIRGEGNPRQGG